MEPRPRKKPRASTSARFTGPSPHQIQTAQVTLEPLFDGQVDYLLRMIRIREIRAIEFLLRPLDLLLSSWYPLAVLRELDGLSQRELGGRLNLKDAAIGKAVDAMERAGIVQRMVGEDRRKSLVYLTNEGRRVADEVAARREQVLATMLDGFSAREIEQFSDFLKRTYHNIDAFVTEAQE